MSGTRKVKACFGKYFSGESKTAHSGLRLKDLSGEEGGKVWCQRKYDAGYDSPSGFGSPYVSRRVCKKCEYFDGKCKYPVLRGLLQNLVDLVELVKVRLRVLTRRLR